jgi:hypothetical protein
MELTSTVREIITMLEESIDTQEWSLVEDSIEELNKLFDVLETNSGDYDLDLNG